MHMNEKPIHYDGSIQNNDSSTVDATINEPFVITDEVRRNISGNPFVIENTK